MADSSPATLSDEENVLIDGIEMFYNPGISPQR